MGMSKKTSDSIHTAEFSFSNHTIEVYWDTFMLNIHFVEPNTLILFPYFSPLLCFKMFMKSGVILTCTFWNSRNKKNNWKIGTNRVVSFLQILKFQFWKKKVLASENYAANEMMIDQKKALLTIWTRVEYVYNTIFYLFWLLNRQIERENEFETVFHSQIVAFKWGLSLFVENKDKEWCSSFC